MNIVDGLAKYKARKKYSNTDIARLLDCSDSVVSQYLRGSSGLSLEKLSILLRDGMTLEEAFGEDTAKVIRDNLKESRPVSDPMTIVVEGLKQIIENLK